jgi:hypothetical protein
VRYSIDTSAILDGWRRYYPRDVFPGMWDAIADLVDDGGLRATEEVLVELERKDDEVHGWALKRQHLFVSIDEHIQVIVTKLLADHEKLLDTRAGRSAADPFVIALAQLQGCAVVTGERATHSLDRPNIPDVCAALGVRCMSLLDMVREQGWRFGR